MKKWIRFLAAFCFVLPVLAGAQSYPNRPVKIIVPFPPGGPVDGVALAERLGIARERYLDNAAIIRTLCAMRTH